MARKKQPGKISLMIAAMAEHGRVVTKEEFIKLAERKGIYNPGARRILAIMNSCQLICKVEQDENLERKYLLTSKGMQRFHKSEREAQRREHSKLSRKTLHRRRVRKKFNNSKISELSPKTVRANSLLWDHILKEVFFENGDPVFSRSLCEFEDILAAKIFRDAGWKSTLTCQEITNMRDSMIKAKVLRMEGEFVLIDRIGQRMLYRKFGIGERVPTRKDLVYKKLVAIAQMFMGLGFHIETLRTSVRNLKRFLSECQAALMYAIGAVFSKKATA